MAIYMMIYTVPRMNVLLFLREMNSQIKHVDLDGNFTYLSHMKPRQVRANLLVSCDFQDAVQDSGSLQSNHWRSQLTRLTNQPTET